MSRFAENEEVDYLIVGVGAGGGVLLQRLARPGFRVLGLEAGPFWDTEPFGPHPMNGVGNVLIRGCTRLGIPVSAGGPVGILQGSRADRPHCIYRGFCIQGCKVGAKASTLITHVPDAIAHGAEIRPHCMVSRINLGKGRRVSGVTYFDRDGREHFQKAKAVVLSGYSIETPRLLLNSACPGFETGLANSSDTVGRYLMAQAGNVVWATLTSSFACTKPRPQLLCRRSFTRQIRTAAPTVDLQFKPSDRYLSRLPSR